MAVFKRFFIFILFILFICVGIIFSSFLNVKNEISISNLKIYTSQVEDISYENSYIKNGTGMIIDANKNNVKTLIEKLNSFSGVSFESKNNAKDIIRYYDARNVFLETTNSDFVNYYGFIDGIDNYVEIDGKKVNFHICEKSGLCKIGIPIIFGSY